MNATTLSELQPLAVVKNVDLTSTYRVGVRDVGHGPLGTWEYRVDQKANHHEHVSVVGRRGAANAPEIHLVRFTNMAAIHRVAPVDQAGGHDQLIDAGLARVVFKRGRESLWKLATSLRLIVLATS